MNGSEKTIAINDSGTIADVLSACYLDSKKFCRTLLPENFKHEFSGIHAPIFDIIDSRERMVRGAICGTRRMGKTTIARSIAAKATLYGDSKFIVYVGKSETHAVMQTENLKRDLLGPEIRELFGSIKTKVVNEVEESWSKKMWVASVGSGTDKHYTLVLPRGVGQQIRGLIWKSPTGENVRPDLIICDDMEDPKTIDNDIIRAESKSWFFGDLMYVLDGSSPMQRVFVIDTIKHEDCLLQNLLESELWKSYKCIVCDDNYKTLAPDFVSQEELDLWVRQAREQHQLDVFAREVLCMATSKEDATFKRNQWRYYSEQDLEFVEEAKGILNVVIVDPAKTAKATSCATGFVVWGVNPDGPLLYLRYGREEHLHPDQQVDRSIELARFYGAKVIGVESTGSGEFVIHPWRNEIARRGLSIEVIELKAKKGTGEFSGLGGGKKMRVASLAHYYRRGQVLHNKVGCEGYESQLIGFPKPKAWNIIDAGGYITEMLEEGGIFFFGNESVDDERSVELEYSDLESNAYPEYSLTLDASESWL